MTAGPRILALRKGVFTIMQLCDRSFCAPLKDEFTTAKVVCGPASRLNCGNTQERSRDAQQGGGSSVLLPRILILLSCCMLIAFCGRIAGAATPVAGVITSPAPGSMLSGASATFNWSAGSGGVTGYYLWVGTSSGTANLVNIGPLSGTSATVNLPANGATIYVELWTAYSGGSFLSNSNTYTESTIAAAAITSPAPGGTLTSASTTFTWNVGSGGVTGYYLWVGTSPGTANLVNIGPLSGPSVTVNLPTNGATIYVELWSVINGAPSLSNSYTYTEGNVAAGTMASPAPGSTLTSASTTFTWNAGSGGVTGYYLWVGTSTGTANLVNIGPLSGTSATVNLPTNGATIYVQLWTAINGTPSLSSSYTYKAASSSPTLSGLICANSSMTAAGTDTCTVTLSAAALSGGFAVSLASNNSAVVVPASVTVAAGATTASFTATVSTVSTAQTVTLTATANSVAKTFALQLSAAAAMLNVNATTIAFGSVNLNTPTTQTLVLTSTGSATLTVSAATITGSGFTISGASFPISLKTNQTATLNVQFDPNVAGAATGQLAIASNCSMGSPMGVSLSGTGATTSYQVNLNWDAPTSSPDPVAGYNVYRAPSGVSTYTQLNTSVMSATTYVDSNVQNGQTYDYIVESVDASGVESVPSNMAAVPVP